MEERKKEGKEGKKTNWEKEREKET